MKRAKWMALAVVAVALVAEFASSGFHLAGAAPLPKVLVCHRPGGSEDNQHTISISGNAVDAHLAHGDSVGPCGNDT